MKIETNKRYYTKVLNDYILKHDNNTSIVFKAFNKKTGKTFDTIPAVVDYILDKQLTTGQVCNILKTGGK